MDFEATGFKCGFDLLLIFAASAQAEGEISSEMSKFVFLSTTTSIPRNGSGHFFKHNIEWKFKCDDDCNKKLQMILKH